MTTSRKNLIPFDPDEPSSFFRKLQRVADAEEWTAKKSYAKALVCISENHEWIATRLEEIFADEIFPVPEDEGEEPGQPEYPSLGTMEARTLEIVDPPSTRQLIMDRFERVKVNTEKPVEQVRQKLEDLFRRAVPEATSETIAMFVIRQLIRGSPEAWQLRLKEENFKTVSEIEAKIRTLSDAGKSAATGSQVEVRRTGSGGPGSGSKGSGGDRSRTCNRCRRSGHLARDCRVRCFGCGKIGHMRESCEQQKSSSKNTSSAAAVNAAASNRPQNSQSGARRTVEQTSYPSENVNAIACSMVTADERKFFEDRTIAAIRRGVLEPSGAPEGIRLYPDENMEFRLTFGYRGELFRSVVDTGSAFNLLRRDVLHRWCPDARLDPPSVRMVCLNKSRLNCIGEIRLEIELDAQTRMLRWIVIESGTDPILIGMEGAVALELTLCARVNRVTNSVEGDTARVEELQNLLDEHERVFSKDQYDVGTVDHEHRIPTVDDRAVYRKEYRVPANLEQRAREMIDCMKKRGLVEECDSAWAAPAIFLEKGNGQLRMVVNYQALNEKTVFDPFPIPDMSGIVRKASKGYLFSTLDARNSFWHIRLREEDRDKTAFVSMGRQYRFRVMPMGLKGAPATLTRALTKTLREEIASGNVFVFYDDIVVCTDDERDQQRAHLQLLKIVLQRLEGAGWKLNREKCKFMQTEVQILGHRVKKGEIAITPAYQAEMEGWPEPTSKKELRKFLGFAGFHAKFIQNYSRIAAPLTELTGNVPFSFGARERHAFGELKRLLTSEPVLKEFVPGQQLTLVSDASDTGWGVVLEQEGHPIEYCSGKWNATERRYSTTKKELKGILNGIKRFSYFLSGTHFILVTDHKALTNGIKEKCDDNELYRWARKLDPYSFSIVHRMGTLIGHADALSRKPTESLHRRLTEVTDYEAELLKDPVMC